MDFINAGSICIFTFYDIYIKTDYVNGKKVSALKFTFYDIYIKTGLIQSLLF